MVVWHGGNGQGKTNWLEAVAVLGTLKSFRTARPADMVRLGGSDAAVEGLAEVDGMVQRFAWRQTAEGRALRREDRPVDAATWLRALRASYFAPEDVAVVRGEPALRRALLDRTVLAARPGYLALARDFRRVLEQKAAMVRAGRADPDHLEVVDDQLAALAARVVDERAATVDRIGEAFGRWYAELAPGEVAEVRYRPWEAPGEALVERLRARFAGQRAAEREAGRLLGSPQRDDLAFRVEGRPARTTASQGQVRSLVLAWKLAEVEWAAEGGDAPLFLIDDLGSELDRARATAFVGVLRRLGAQVFVTTTDPGFVPDPEREARFYEVVAGRCRLAGR